MLFGEWNWDDAKDVWAEEVEERVNEKWQSVVFDKDIALADNKKALADNKKLLLIRTRK